MHQVEVLKDHADLVPLQSQRVAGQVGNVLAVHQHPARIRTFQQVDGAQQRALAGTAGADNAEHLAAPNVQRDLVDGLDRLRLLAAQLEIDGNIV